MLFVGGLGPPKIFSKIKLVQNRAILDIPVGYRGTTRGQTVHFVTN